MDWFHPPPPSLSRKDIARMIKRNSSIIRYYDILRYFAWNQNLSWIRVKSVVSSPEDFVLRCDVVLVENKKKKKRKHSVLSKTEQCASRDIKKLGGKFSFELVELVAFSSSLASCFQFRSRRPSLRIGHTKEILFAFALAASPSLNSKPFPHPSFKRGDVAIRRFSNPLRM